MMYTQRGYRAVIFKNGECGETPITEDLRGLMDKCVWAKKADLVDKFRVEYVDMKVHILDPVEYDFI